MSDDKSQRGSPDSSKRIDIHDPNELRHWSQSLGVTPEQLKELVAHHGTSAERVREALRK